MDQENSHSYSVARHVRSMLLQESGTGTLLSGSEVRAAAQEAARASFLAGTDDGAGLARSSVEGAVTALAEIGSDTALLVRDAVIGVIEGVAQVISVTPSTLAEVVAGAVHGSGETGSAAAKVSRAAVEGAVIGASNVGLDTEQAAVAVADSAVAATVEAGADLTEAAGAGMAGVFSGVSASGGNLKAVVRSCVQVVVERSARCDDESLARVAEEIMESAIVGAARTETTPEEAAELVSVAAYAAVIAAYRCGAARGDRVREAVIRTVSRQRSGLSPSLQHQLALVAESLQDNLHRGHPAWRVEAVVRAVRHLLKAGPVDQAASLAYFTVLSFFPLVALSVLVFSLFADVETIRVVLEGLVTHYFPASAALFHESVGGLLGNSAAFGALALGSLVFSANGLFMAANRSVNRVMGAEDIVSLRGRILESLVTGFLGILLMLSIGMSILVQIAIGESRDHLEPMVGTSLAWQILLGAVSAFLPPLVTGLAFSAMYRNFSHVYVEWRNAIFGGLIAVLLFETGKHLFFFLAGMAAQRSIVYGPAASAVLLLMWAFMAGIVFLYGAALVRAAGELRPGPVAPSVAPSTEIAEEENRE